LAFDSNAIIYFVEHIEPYYRWLVPIFERVESGACIAYVSVVSEAEALVLPLKESNTGVIQDFEDFLSAENVQVIDTDRAIARRGAMLRADLDLGLPDSLVMATAIEVGCDAIVGNDKKCARRVTQVPYMYLDEVVSWPS
jgi:predicted nucleic acid-binding protein